MRDRSGCPPRGVAGGAERRVVGADLNAAMLEVARVSAGGDVEWVESRWDRLPFDDDTFTH